MPRLKLRRALRHLRIWMTKTKLSKIYAHRGFHDKPQIPENSLPAFRRAVENGFGSEFDVHMIADGSLVVFHDEELERETGVIGKIEDYTLTELRKLRLEGTDEYIPTFDEVLAVYDGVRREDGSVMQLLIELKVDRGNHRELVKAVTDRLDSFDGEFVLESFDPRAVFELKRQRPELTRGQLIQNYVVHDMKMPKYQGAILAAMPYNRLNKPDFIAFRFADKDMPSLKRAFKNKDVGKAVWTVRTPRAFKVAQRMGCSIIFEKFNPNTDL